VAICKREKVKIKKKNFRIFSFFFFQIIMSMIDCITDFFASHSHLQLNKENFRALFGIGLQTMLFSWSILQRIDSIEDIIPIHLLWTLYFLKQYLITRNIWYFQVNRKTFTKKVWKVIALLSMYLNTVSIIIYLY
jgi:hypothetical protein